MNTQLSTYWVYNAFLLLSLAGCKSEPCPQVQPQRPCECDETHIVSIDSVKPILSTGIGTDTRYSSQSVEDKLCREKTDKIVGAVFDKKGKSHAWQTEVDLFFTLTDECGILRHPEILNTIHSYFSGLTSEELLNKFERKGVVESELYDRINQAITTSIHSVTIREFVTQ